MDLDKEFEAVQKYKQRSFAALLHKIRRHFDKWAETEIGKNGYADFKMGDMPFLMNIDATGTTNGELAKRAGVTKQAMSKVIKELTRLGIIEMRKHEVDSRSQVIFLTDRGKMFVITARNCVSGLFKDYKEVVGEGNYEIMIDSMIKILEHHQRLSV
jgi:DNA-binding MarR family transcriptional regulator